MATESNFCLKVCANCSKKLRVLREDITEHGNEFTMSNQGFLTCTFQTNLMFIYRM